LIAIELPFDSRLFSQALTVSRR